MRLIERLYQKREAARLEYDKWNLLIKTVEEDEDFKTAVGLAANGKAGRALAQLNGTNGHVNGSNGHAIPHTADSLLRTISKRTGKPKRIGGHQTPEQRAAQGERMRQLWVTKRALMMKATKKGLKAAHAAKNAKKRAAKKAAKKPSASASASATA
jgi:hypothetical protein